MFTGIIQSVGRIARTEKRGGDLRLTIETGKLDLSTAVLGDSIAVNGVCLTAVKLDKHRFEADVSGETLARTTLGDKTIGSAVNLEPALRAGDRLGGHLVSGHVDGVGRVIARNDDARSVQFQFEVPASLARYIAQKGSVTIEGVSLTVNAVEGAGFAVNIVPHTQQETTLGELQVGSRVNVEVDLIARYLERLLLGDRAGNPGEGVTTEFLAQHGFLK